MRFHLFGFLTVIFATAFCSWAVAADEAKLANRIFANADKNDDGWLDDKELPEAKRIFKSAIFEKKRVKDMPRGKITFQKIEDAATQGTVDGNKDGKVSKDEWLSHMQDAFKKKESILKDDKEWVAQAPERQRQEQARREKERAEKDAK